MKQIKIERSDVYVLVDDDDYRELSQHKWYLTSKGRPIGRVGLPPIGKLKPIMMHRLIMEARPDQIVDHIDRNPLNNQRSNLRFATHSQNSMNRKARNTRSGYKGVCWADGKWLVQVYLKKKRLHRSSHVDLVEAAKKYDEVARAIFGEYAHLNFPDGKTPRPGTYENYPTWAENIDQIERYRRKVRYHADPEYRQKVRDRARAESRVRYWRDIEATRAYQRAKHQRYRNRAKGVN